MRKLLFFAYAKTKTQISAFVFAIRIVQSLYYLNPKFQASSHLLWLYSLVCVGPGRKPRRPVFSQQGLYKGRRLCTVALAWWPTRSSKLSPIQVLNTLSGNSQPPTRVAIKAGFHRKAVKVVIQYTCIIPILVNYYR